MKGKSAEGERCLKRSAWAYVEEAYDCHRLDGVLPRVRGIVNGIFHSGNAVFELLCKKDTELKHRGTEISQN